MGDQREFKSKDPIAFRNGNAGFLTSTSAHRGPSPPRVIVLLHGEIGRLSPRAAGPRTASASRGLIRMHVETREQRSPRATANIGGRQRCMNLRTRGDDRQVLPLAQRGKPLPKKRKSAGPPHRPRRRGHGPRRMYIAPCDPRKRAGWHEAGWHRRRRPPSDPRCCASCRGLRWNGDWCRKRPIEMPEWCQRCAPKYADRRNRS